MRPTSYSFISFFLFLLLFTLSPQGFAATSVGQVVWVKGAVQALDTAQHARPLERRSPLYEHDTIVTGSGSGQIIFTDSSIVVLREGTTFRIDQYKFSAAAPKDNQYVAEVAKGGFRTITGLISKSNPNAYEVKTPVATIGVRGTDYSIFYSTTRGLALKLDKGAIFVSNPAGTLELNSARNRVYAEVAGLHVSPVLTSKRSSDFDNQPAPTSSNSSGSGKSSGGMGGGSGSNGTIPKGQTKTVSSFCIN